VLSLEAIVQQAGHGAGGEEALVAAIVAACPPRRVLAVGDGAALRAVRAVASLPRVRVVAMEVDGQGLARAAAAARPGTALDLHRASLLRDPGGAPHYTRVPELVAVLKRCDFDLAVVAAPAAADALYLTLAQVVSLVAPGGVLCCTPLESSPGATEVARRLAAEGEGTVVLWDGEPGALLVRSRRPRHTHEETRALRRTLPAEEPALAAALAAHDHGAICARLRHWLATRLAWSTADLLLPLAALPPPTSVLDVVAQCAEHEGGVWSFGAAVTLAMLYRAFGYPATVYPHGVPGLYTHMLTLVRVPDGRVLLEDAFFDAEPRVDGRAATFAEAVALARRGEAARLAFVSEATAPRPHVYSRAGVAAALADGYLGAAEADALTRALAGCGRLGGEARLALPQKHTTSLEAFLRLPCNARRLEEAERRTGLAGALGLLAHPCGVLPLTGHRGCDREIARVVGALARPAGPVAATG